MRDKSKYAKVSIGYYHFLRSGSGPHTDKKKDAARNECRKSKHRKKDWL